MTGGGQWVEILGSTPTMLGRALILPCDTPKAIEVAEARSEQELRQILKNVLQGDSASFMDPAGEFVVINNILIEHIIESQQRFDGREKAFPFIPELIADPFEIWESSAENQQTGEISFRRRYVKYLSLEKPKYRLVTQQFEGVWTGFTFFRGTKPSTLKNLRKGELMWGK
ncbi:PBECR2 nuclease fold domain-containing protein [Anthocerotibacter panamensis]|uniref:PBECR2 nuclease fold domain-containing protein n=1 Tax=Anthocerotibacter panamensis TaxID=2857077 RepID=UPI001C406754|nr:PBECR2 nuclease fold domain-containing protein [Anthocerotibacter panamensis]